MKGVDGNYYANVLSNYETMSRTTQRTDSNLNTQKSSNKENKNNSSKILTNNVYRSHFKNTKSIALQAKIITEKNNHKTKL